jgi:PAS domain S-box-containing protein
VRDDGPVSTVSPDRPADRPPAIHGEAADSASWQRYRLHADAGTDGAYESDVDGIIRWVSPSVREILGWEPEQMLGKLGLDFVHPLDIPRMDALRADLRQQGRPHESTTCMVRTASGGYRSLTMWARPIVDDAGAVTGAAITIRDTHDADATLRALATLSQANRALVRAADEADLIDRMCRTLVDTGRCLRTGRTQVRNRLAEDPNFRPWTEAATRHGFACSIALPVLVEGTVDGALMVYADEADAFDALAQELLEDLAADLGYGIERMRGVEALRVTTTREAEQRARLQSIFDSSIDPLVLMEAIRDDSGQLVDLRYLAANAAACAANRLTAEQMIGARLLDLFPGQLEHGPLQQYFSTVETGEPTVLDDYSYAHEVLAEDRRYDIRAVTCGDGIALTWRDVTDRHREAQALADNERLFRLLAENSSDVIILASANDVRSLWVSPSVERMLGWAPEEFIGAQPLDYLHPDDTDAALNAYLQAPLDQDLRQVYRLRRRDGSHCWVEALTHRIPDADEQDDRLVVRLRDIDAQVRAEQALAEREQRYRLLAENASDVVWQVAPDGTLVFCLRT